MITGKFKTRLVIRSIRCFLSVMLVLTYPAHLVIDHSGLFESDHVETAHHDFSHDEECILCVNLTSLESDGQTYLVVFDEISFSQLYGYTSSLPVLVMCSATRAPPCTKEV